MLAKVINSWDIVQFAISTKQMTKAQCNITKLQCFKLEVLFLVDQDTHTDRVPYVFIIEKCTSYVKREVVVVVVNCHNPKLL